MEIEERLERLEKQSQRMKLVGGGALVVAAALIVMTCATPGPKILETEKIIIRDSSGKHRGMFGMADDGPGLAFYDENGKQRAWFGVDKDGASLELYDAQESVTFVAPDPE